MTDSAKYTERALVLAQREAFVAGVDARYDQSVRPNRLSCVGEFDKHCASVAACLRYPLPKVTRPRVLTDQYGTSWRVRDGQLEMKPTESISWTVAYRHGVAALFRDLLANPTEEVDDDA